VINFEPIDRKLKLGRPAHSAWCDDGGKPWGATKNNPYRKNSISLEL